MRVAILVLLAGCEEEQGGRGGRNKPDPDPPTCLQEASDRDCVDGVGSCDHCATQTKEWYECHDGWKSLDYDPSRAERDFVCHCTRTECG